MTTTDSKKKKKKRGIGTWQGVRVLQFCMEGSDHRLVRAELFPPGWPLQHLAALHHRRPQVLVELRERETKIKLPRETSWRLFRGVWGRKKIRDRDWSQWCKQVSLFLTKLSETCHYHTQHVPGHLRRINGKDPGKPKCFWRGRFKLYVSTWLYLSISAANRWVENEIRRSEDIHQCYCIILQLEERHRAEQVSDKQSRTLTVQRYEEGGS